MTQLATSSDSLPRRIADGLAKLSQALRSHAWQDGSPRGLTPTQGKILAHLATHRGARLQDLAASLQIRPATASEAVKALVEKEWVSKSRSLEDGRALVLDLTHSGRELAARSLQWPEILASTVAELDSDQQAALLEATIHMIRRLHEQGLISVARLCVTCTHFRPQVHTDRARPHHCALIDQALAAQDLRVDCAEHEPAGEDRQPPQ